MNSDLKKRLSAGDVTIGSWLSLGHASIAEILARAGFDWLVIDLEHSTISIREAGELIRVIDLCGIAPLVRVTSNDGDQVKRVMDAGAHGVIVPMVVSAGEAARAVAATRFAPAGTRGAGIARAQRFTHEGFREYQRWQDNGPLVIVQIEHVDAVERIDEILSVPGVDAFCIGPYDLSCSMAAPGDFDRPEFKAATRRVLDAGRRHGRAAGFHLVEPDPLRLQELIDDGYTFVAYSVDFRMLDTAARLGVRAVKGASA